MGSNGPLTLTDDMGSPGGSGPIHRRGADMDSLPSIFELFPDVALGDSLVAVATYVVGPILGGDVESWDLTLYGEGFEELSWDPFSFAGQFLHEGLVALHANLLGAAGFIFPSQWICNDARTEYHATIRWMTRTPTDSV